MNFGRQAAAARLCWAYHWTDSCPCCAGGAHACSRGAGHLGACACRHCGAVAQVPPPPKPRTHSARFEAYARIHGRTPQAQRAHDRAASPGDPSLPFARWCDARIAEWRARNGRGPNDRYMSTADHAAVDAWLETLHPSAKTEPSP